MPCCIRVAARCIRVAALHPSRGALHPSRRALHPSRGALHPSRRVQPWAHRSHQGTSRHIRVIRGGAWARAWAGRGAAGPVRRCRVLLRRRPRYCVVLRVLAPWQRAGRLLQRATAVIAPCNETAVASRQGAEAVRTGGAPGTPWLVALTKVSLRVPPSPSESLRAILSPSESLRVAPSLFDSLRVAPSRSESGVRGFAPALVRVAACGVCVCVCVG